MATATVIYGREIAPKVGSVVRFPQTHVTRLLAEGMEYVDESFKGSAFTLLGLIENVPVNITVTGRTFQRYSGENWVKINVEFVKDGEPNTNYPAWLMV